MATGAYSDDKIEIEKLEGSDDWWEWKCNITLQLKAEKLWSHVDGSVNLAEDASNDEREKFEHTAVRAQAMIVRGLSKRVTSLVLRCDGPKAVWDRLVEEFEVKTVQSTLLLQTQVRCDWRREVTSRNICAQWKKFMTAWLCWMTRLLRKIKSSVCWQVFLQAMMCFDQCCWHRVQGLSG